MPDTSAPNTRPLRVGMAGFFIECNRWAPVTTAAMFASSLDLAGEALQAELARDVPRVLPDTRGFMAAMSRLGAWQPVALRMVAAQPGGPVAQDYFDALLQDLAQRVRAAGPLDALFISSHGAALTTDQDDADGELFTRLRALVGPAVPIVAVFDLHANFSPRMAAALSACVAYRTNPHNDLEACGEELAQHLHTVLQDGPGVVELVKLPLVPPATAQLVAPGTPYSDLIALGQRHLGGAVLNVSLCGGFALADSVNCGFGVVVTARAGQRADARALALTLAAEVWRARGRFVTQLTPLQDAVQAAVACGLADVSSAPLILADVADNPGGGGGGNTTTLLAALLAAQAQGVLLAVFTDAALAQTAHTLGVGATFDATFNQGSADPLAPELHQRARVLALSDGHFVGRRGLLKGSAQSMGPSALLALGGVQVAVISQRQQLLDPAQLEVLGIHLDDASTDASNEEPTRVRTLVVKSRGHFRAAFAHFTSPDRIVEVDCPGLTTPNLRTLTWTRMPRPVYPLDPDTPWQPPADPRDGLA